MKTLLLTIFIWCSIGISARPAEIHVFVALADNATQGIAPVPAKIGNGDDAAHNLYWGCDEALPPVFRASADWKFLGREPGPKPAIIERLRFAHASGKWQLVADGYRGSAIRECTVDFFQALASDQPVDQLPLVAYLGHDGLMDFPLPSEAIVHPGPGRQAIVLCCMSQRFFGPHLAAAGARPLLTTTQLMYPGGFILRDALAGWARGETPAQIQRRAAAAYAHNQGVSIKAAQGVFSTPENTSKIGHPFSNVLGRGLWRKDVYCRKKIPSNSAAPTQDLPRLCGGPSTAPSTAVQAFQFLRGRRAGEGDPEELIDDFGIGHFAFESSLPRMFPLRVRSSWMSGPLTSSKTCGRAVSLLRSQSLAIRRGGLPKLASNLSTSVVSGL